MLPYRNNLDKRYNKKKIEILVTDYINLYI